MRSFIAFLNALRRHFVPTVTGGIMIAGLFLYQTLIGNAPQWLYIVILFAAFLITVFLAWHEQYEATTATQTKSAYNELEHDRKIFQKGDELYSEDIVREMINNAIFMETRERSELKRCDDFLHWCGNIGSHFLNADLQSTRAAFIQALSKSNNAMVINYFYIDPETYRFHPALKLKLSDGDEVATERYYKYKNEVDSLIKETEAAYDVYRDMVKKRLLL